jgi:hypothetical protein
MSPKCVSVLVGTAWLMWLAPAFHHDPRPLKAEAEARNASIPRRQSSRRCVCGRFHGRHRMQHSLQREPLIELLEDAFDVRPSEVRDPSPESRGGVPERRSIDCARGHVARVYTSWPSVVFCVDIALYRVFRLLDLRGTSMRGFACRVLDVLGGIFYLVDHFIEFVFESHQCSFVFCASSRGGKVTFVRDGRVWSLTRAMAIGQRPGTRSPRRS